MSRPKPPVSRWARVVIALGVVTAAANTAQPLLVASLIDGILQGRSVLVILAAIGLVIAVLLLSELASKVVRARYTRELRDRWRQLLLDRAFLGRASEADVVSRSNNDVETVISSLHLGRLDLVLSLIGLAMAAVGLTTISPVFLGLVAACAAVMLLVPLALRHRIGGRKAVALDRASTWNSLLIRTVQAAATFRRRRALLPRLTVVGRASQHATRAQLSAETYEGVVDIVIGGVLFLNQFLIILIGWLLIRSDAISVGELVAALQFEDLLLVPMLSITDALTDIAGGRQIADALLAEPESSGDEERSVEDSGRTSDVRPAEEPDAPLLSCAGGQLSWGEDGPGLTVPPLQVAADELILVTGMSGTGKTTVLRMLAGELPDAGVSCSAAGRVDYVPAEEPGFEESYAYDVSLGRSVTATTLREVTRSVDAPSGRLARMVDRDTSIGASLGERQRISLARVLVDPPDVLVLDEALGHLDAPSANELLRVLREDAGITVILVRHTGVDDSLAWTQHWEVTADEAGHTVTVYRKHARNSIGRSFGL